MKYRLARALVGTLVSWSAVAGAQAPAKAPAAASSAAFPSGDAPAAPPAAAPAPAPGAPAPAPGAPAPAPGAPAPAAPGAAPAPVPGSEAAPIPLPPPAAAPAPAPAAAPAAATPVVSTEPPAPPAPTDTRPNRERRPFAIGGELGWNGLAGLGVNFSYHPIPYLAIDTGAGLGLAGLKVGLRLRANFLLSEWTPVLGAGILYETGAGDDAIEYMSRGDSAMIRVTESPYAQLVAGANYTGDGGFTFMATVGYAILLKDNAEYVTGSREVYDDIRELIDGGVVLSVAFGYAF